MLKKFTQPVDIANDPNNNSGKVSRRRGCGQMTDLRELLILILALLILFSLLRAVYVIHRRRKGQIRLSIDKSMPPEAELEDPEFSELPNGGARVVPTDGTEESAPEQAAVHEESDAEDPLAGDNVPVLLDPVAVTPVAEAPEPREQAPQRKRKKKWKEEILESNGKDREQSDFDMELGAVSITAGERIGSDSPKPLKTAEQAESKPEVETDAEIESEEISADRIITINVIAGEDREFNGRELWDFLHAAGLRHDQMKILSKTEGNREDGKPIFRVANIVNPGTFDAGAIDDFSTPGISMFMLLPAPINNLLAFEQMLTIARRLAEALDGQLLDSRRQEMTAQGIEQAQRRIREFDMETTGSPSVSNGI